MDEFEGEDKTNPPLRNDQHPLFAVTVPMHFNRVSSVARLAVIGDESAFLILIQTVYLLQTTGRGH